MINSAKIKGKIMDLASQDRITDDVFNARVAATDTEIESAQQDQSLDDWNPGRVKRHAGAVAMPKRFRPSLSGPDSKFARYKWAQVAISLRAPAGKLAGLLGRKFDFRNPAPIALKLAVIIFPGVF